MAALLVVSLCVPEAFGDLGLTFAIAYGGVRAAHIVLFLLASRGDPVFRSSVVGLGIGTAVGAGLLIAGASVDDVGVRTGIWALALALDMAEPFFFGSPGWKLEPAHFAERHGLIVIIALGESIVAVGVGADHGVDAGVIVAAVAGIVHGGRPVVGVLRRRVDDRRPAASPKRPPAAAQNDLARDAYSYLHFPMVAGVVLVALGMKTTIAHVDEPLDLVPAVALCGGAALYLLGHVAFAWRSFGAVKVHRLLDGGGGRGADPAGAGARRPGDGDRAGSAALRADRLRDDPLRRDPDPDPQRGRVAPRRSVGGEGLDPLPERGLVELAVAGALQRRRSRRR